MSEPEMRMASDTEIASLEKMAAPFVDALQSTDALSAMKLWCYVTARLVLDLEPRAGHTRVGGFDVWAKTVRTTIERNEQLHRKSLS